MFSGNPIPFSRDARGIVFCLADWWSSDTRNRVFTLLICFIGFVFSGYLSGTRAALLSIVIISPIIIFFLCKNIKLTLITASTITLIVVICIQVDEIFSTNIFDFSRIINGLETLTALNASDSSISQRIQMWSASLRVIYDNPIFGYGIINSFDVIGVYLPDSFPFSYTHPHNDILAGAIAAGLIGGIATFISLIAGFLSSLLTVYRSIDNNLFGLMISIPTLITANVSTVFITILLPLGWHFPPM